MTDIRTATHKLFGVLDLNSYELAVKDGKNERRIPISKEGLKMRLKSRDPNSGKYYWEEVSIPPKK